MAGFANISGFGIPSKVNFGPTPGMGQTNQSGQGFNAASHGGNQLPQQAPSRPTGGAGAGGQVQGAQTKQNGGWYNGQQYWAPGQGPSQPQGQSQPQGGSPGSNQLQNPPAPDMSVFDQIINPVIANFESLIGQQQTQSADQITGMKATQGNEITQAQNEQTDQTNSLNTQATGQTTAANNAIEDAKKMYSEMSQGDLARYGNSSGTGAFLAEQLGQSTGHNISQLQQGLGQSLQDINDKITQVKSAGALAIQGINTQFDNAIQQEQDNLQKYIVQIRGNEAMLQSNKAQMAAQAVQHYQDTVANINSQRAQMTQQYSIAALNAQTQLQIYGQKGQAMLSQLQSPNYGNIATQGMSATTSQAPTPTQDTGSLPFYQQPQGGIS